MLVQHEFVHNVSPWNNSSTVHLLVLWHVVWLLNETNSSQDCDHFSYFCYGYVLEEKIPQIFAWPPAKPGKKMTHDFGYQRIKLAIIHANQNIHLKLINF